MNTSPAKFHATYHEPDRNEPCSCGSGLKFKKCCSGTYSSSAAKLFRSAYNSGNYQEALIQARRHFTWYVLSHKAHTVQMIQANHLGAEDLLKLDIEALSDLLENLQHCYLRLGIGDDFPLVIGRVRVAIDDARWLEKVAYVHGLWQRFHHNDKSAAFEAIASIDFTSCNDPNILSLYIEVCPKRLTLIESLAVIDRLLANSTDEAVLLQYRVLKAVRFYQVCQNEEGDRCFEDAIRKFELLPHDKKSHNGKRHLAFALEMFGKISQRANLTERAKTLAEELILEARENSYSPTYIAELLRLIADCDEALGSHALAIAVYRDSLDHDDKELTKIFLARSLCHNHEELKAADLLSSIQGRYLDEPGRFDLAISWAVLAASTRRDDHLELAKNLLKGVEAHDPVFIQLRDKLMIDLLETSPTYRAGVLQRFLRGINKYIILEPNFAGIGVNLNRIIERFVGADGDDSSK